MLLRAFLPFLIVLCSIQAAFAQSKFPERPVKIVVYTESGGVIDQTARQLARVLEKDVISVPVVVENKKGAGGLVAIEHVLRQKPDGHTLFALTSSVVSKVVAAKREERLKELHFLAMVVDDYECLIVHRDGAIKSLAHLVSKDGASPRIWAGPASGGTDHLFAQKVWNALGTSGNWVPYRSGGEAIASILGKHADVYVGNPQDTLGRPDLKILAVSAPERLEGFPEVPTFRELGFDQLTGESLWRGFAVHGKTPVALKEEWKSLLNRAIEDPEWKKFVSAGAALPRFEVGQQFLQLVQNQIEADRVVTKNNGTK